MSSKNDSDILSYLVWIISYERSKMQSITSNEDSSIMGIYTEIRDDDDWLIVAIIIGYMYGMDYFDDDENW